jgi:hypothetical protein
LLAEAASTLGMPRGLFGSNHLNLQNRTTGISGITP